MTQTHALWVEKFRPTRISDYIFQNDDHRRAITQMINDKSIPHLLLSGHHGAGKTTIAKILINSIGVDSTDVLTINASDESGIGTFRDTVKNFATSAAMGSFKIVHLEESDMLTPQAQAALKSFMEEVSDYVRFILTCNTVNRIIPPIRSRCQEFNFHAGDRNDITEYVFKILTNEGISFNLDTLDKYVAIGYPDVRKIVNMVQQNVNDSTLHLPSSNTGSSEDYKFSLIDAIERNKWQDARKIACDNVLPTDWENIYRFLYDNISKSPKFQTTDAWEEGILIIADHLQKHSFSADPEICGASCFIKLSMV